MVEGTCLENKQGESSRGFKSYFLRQILNPSPVGGFFFSLYKTCSLYRDVRLHVRIGFARIWTKPPTRSLDGSRPRSCGMPSGPFGYGAQARAGLFPRASEADFA